MQVVTSGKRAICLTSVNDLPFTAEFTSPDKTYIKLSGIQGKDADYTCIRKAYAHGSSGEIKIYLDEVKFIVSDPENISVAPRYPWSRPVTETVTDDEPEEVPAPSTTELDRYQLLKSCVENNLPVYLHGPAGSGKNYSLEKVAETLGLDFYFSNSISQEYKLTGFIDAKGNYHETEFYRAFTKGGLFFLDELDASAPDVLILLNAAIANRYFEFPNQPRVDAHPNFRVVAAGNTVGTGSDEQYTGRMPIDQATLDRFVFIEWNYDPAVEVNLCEGDYELLDFVRDLRKAHLNTTFSYRCIISAVTLKKAEVPLKNIIIIAILKGLNKDAINGIHCSGKSNRYWEVLKEIQRAA